jgi:hypothetical protein
MVQKMAITSVRKQKGVPPDISSSETGGTPNSKNDSD